MAIELALTPDSRWGLSATETVRLAAAAGFSAVGLSLPQAQLETAEDLRDSELRCHELLALVLGRDHDRALRQAEMLAEAAERVDAEWVLTTFAAPIDDDMIATITRCAEIFAAAGSALAAEFSPLGSLPTLSAAVELLAAVGSEHAGIVIDTWHFFRGTGRVDELEVLPLDLLAYVQFCDAPGPASEELLDETLNGRSLPGEGDFALERFASTLLSRGWQGLVSVEVLSSQLRERPSEEAVAAAYSATVPYWS